MLEEQERERQTARKFHRAMQLVASGQATDEEIGYREEPCPRASFDLDAAREEYAAARAMYVSALKRKYRQTDG